MTPVEADVAVLVTTSREACTDDDAKVLGSVPHDACSAAVVVVCAWVALRGSRTTNPKRAVSKDAAIPRVHYVNMVRSRPLTHDHPAGLVEVEVFSVVLVVARLAEVKLR